MQKQLHVRVQWRLSPVSWVVKTPPNHQFQGTPSEFGSPLTSTVTSLHPSGVASVSDTSLPLARGPLGALCAATAAPRQPVALPRAAAAASAASVEHEDADETRSSWHGARRAVLPPPQVCQQKDPKFLLLFSTNRQRVHQQETGQACMEWYGVMKFPVSPFLMQRWTRSATRSPLEPPRFCIRHQVCQKGKFTLLMKVLTTTPWPASLLWRSVSRRQTPFFPAVEPHPQRHSLSASELPRRLAAPLTQPRQEAWEVSAVFPPKYGGLNIPGKANRGGHRARFETNPADRRIRAQ